MRHIHFHAYFGIAEIPLLQLNTIVDSAERSKQSRFYVEYVETHLHSEVTFECLFVDIQFFACFHEHRLAPHVVYISLIVTVEFCVDNMIELRQIFFIHIFAVVLKQRNEHLFVEGLVP